MAGMVGMYVWIVPASRFGHPDCKHCGGTGKNPDLWGR
jgi:hypothetical protein